MENSLSLGFLSNGDDRVDSFRKNQWLLDHWNNRIEFLGMEDLWLLGNRDDCINNFLGLLVDGNDCIYNSLWLLDNGNESVDFLGKHYWLLLFDDRDNRVNLLGLWSDFGWFDLWESGSSMMNLRFVTMIVLDDHDLLRCFLLFMFHSFLNRLDGFWLSFHMLVSLNFEFFLRFFDDL